MTVTSPGVPAGVSRTPLQLELRLLIVDGDRPSRRAISRTPNPCAHREANPLALEPGQIPGAAHRLSDPQGRESASLSPPAIPGLAADAQEATRLHGPDAAQDQPPVLVLDA